MPRLVYPFSMKRLITTLCLVISLAIGSFGVGLSGDFQKGVDAYDKGDYATALKEFMPLAEQGDASAQYNLGQIYRQGLGVPEDYKTAVKWNTLAAEQGHAKAQYNLGVTYALGQGVIEDKVYAHMWANIANSNGHENGKKLMEFLLEQGMTPSQIEKAQDLARECVKKNYKGC